MENNEITAKGYLLNLIFVIIIFTAIPSFMFYKLSNKLFQWKEFNPNGIITLAFLAFSLIGILSWIKLFDNKPSLIVNKKGIGIRKSILPFSSLKYIDWSQVNFVELNVIKQKNIQSTILIVHRNDTSKTKTIDLESLNYPIEEIIALFRQFSKLLNYRDRI